MAKVTGPLYSMSASGKLANAMVFFGWKGLNVVRSWVVPANPKSASQGDARQMIGGTGKAVGKVQAGKDFHQKLMDLGVIPSGQTKQSFLVKYIMDNYLASTTAYIAALAELTGHTAYSDFEEAADALDLTLTDITYSTIADYDKALGFYLLAKAGIALGLDITPYSVGITNWVTANITAHAANFTTAT